MSNHIKIVRSVGVTIHYVVVSSALFETQSDSFSRDYDAIVRNRNVRNTIDPCGPTNRTPLMQIFAILVGGII